MEINLITVEEVEEVASRLHILLEKERNGTRLCIGDFFICNQIYIIYVKSWAKYFSIQRREILAEEISEAVKIEALRQWWEGALKKEPYFYNNESMYVYSIDKNANRYRLQFLENWIKKLKTENND